MSHKIIIVGGGDHATVVLDAIQSTGMKQEAIGFSSPGIDRESSPLDKMIEWIGDDEILIKRLSQEPDLKIAFGIGRIGPKDDRQRIIAKFDDFRDKWATIVHASSIVSPSAKIGKGSCVLAGCILNPHCTVGEAAIINTGSLLEHDVRIGSRVVIATGVRIGGGTAIGHNCFIGMGTSIRDHIQIGDSAVVGMGSAVLNNIEPNAFVCGVPATDTKQCKE